jgi:hypothetical protein
MKNKRKKNLLFGDLIAAAYRAWGATEAGEKLRLAIKTRVVVFQAQDELLISRGEGELYE